MPIILSQKRYQLEYKDIIGEQYHYPRRYWSNVRSGETFIYYHPGEDEDTEQYYFGAGRIGSISEDPSLPDHRYAEILNYIHFRKRVGFKDRSGNYLEERPGVGTHFWNAVRRIDDNIFERILELAGMVEIAAEEFDIAPELFDYAGILAELNKRYKGAEPKSYRRLVTQLDRPTAISAALKAQLGYVCQICGVAGFRKKDGRQYAELHHLLPLHELVPDSLVTENILVVCANCHKQLHYASVDMTVIDHKTINLTINGYSHRLNRNIFE